MLLCFEVNIFLKMCWEKVNGPCVSINYSRTATRQCAQGHTTYEVGTLHRNNKF